MPCTNGCVINYQTGGDHAYCECECHVGSLPAIPPSRKRRVISTGKSFVDTMIDERDALRLEIGELRNKLAEVEGERDALRECGSKLHVMYDLNSILYKALENIANQGYSFGGAENADLAKRALALYEDRAK